MDKIIEHYNKAYFDDYQKKIGEFGGLANKFKFQGEIHSDDTVLDFGCGGGFLLQNLSCKYKIGIEINEVARNHCKLLGIECYDSLDNIEDESRDVIVSNHCLEHIENPYLAISQLYKKLKRGGKIIIFVPLESYKCNWSPADVNHHLYSFSPMNLGNLLQSAGFKNIRTGALLHKWMPHYDKVYKLSGYKIFHFLSWIYGHYNKHSVQVRGLGIK
jgi:SAM-dependent methyltransferase